MLKHDGIRVFSCWDLYVKLKNICPCVIFCTFSGHVDHYTTEDCHIYVMHWRIQVVAKSMPIGNTFLYFHVGLGENRLAHSDSKSRPHSENPGSDTVQCEQSPKSMCKTIMYSTLLYTYLS